MKIMLAVVTAALVAGCATGYQPVYSFNHMEVINLSGGTIRDVKMRVAGFPRTLNCDAVRANAICVEHFGKRRYPQQGIDLSWTSADGVSRSERLAPAVPVTLGSGLPLQVYLEIRENGSVEAYYRQKGSIR